MPPPAPWLNPPDIAAEYSKGLQIGASIGQEEARLQAEHERTIMEAQARAESAKQQALQAQARIQTEAAYRTATLGLQQQRLQDAKAENDAKTKEAALTMSDRMGLAKALASGVPTMDALAQFPRAMTAAQADTARRDEQGRVETARHNTAEEAMRKTSLDREQQALTDRENKQAVPSKPKVTMVPVPLKDANGTVTGKVMLPETDPRAQAVLKEGGQATPPEVSDPEYWNKVSRLRNTGSAAEVPPSGGGAPAFQKPAEVRAALKAKQITRDQAEKILRDQFGME